MAEHRELTDEERELASPCGLYCGNCQVYRATTDRALVERLASRLRVSFDLVRCDGCRAQDGKIMGSPQCETYACVTQRGYKFCFQCPDFPCLKLAPCADRADVLPHNTKIYSLLLMQRMGLDEWIGESGDIRDRYFRGKKPHGGSEVKL